MGRMWSESLFGFSIDLVIRGFEEGNIFAVKLRHNSKVSKIISTSLKSWFSSMMVEPIIGIINVFTISIVYLNEFNNRLKGYRLYSPNFTVTKLKTKVFPNSINPQYSRYI